MLQDPDTNKLKALVGTWETIGKTYATSNSPAIVVHATDTYEWLPGKQGLLHSVDAHMGENSVQGAEIIGFDPEKKAYVTQYFGTDGPNAYTAYFEEENGVLIWRMESARDRFRGSFSADGNTITGHWQLKKGDTWQPWMDITLKKK